MKHQTLVATIIINDFLNKLCVARTSYYTIKIRLQWQQCILKVASYDDKEKIQGSCKLDNALSLTIFKINTSQ
jgi:hypothetical protein